jgi:hypothetical protein
MVDSLFIFVPQRITLTSLGCGEAQEKCSPSPALLGRSGQRMGYNGL